MKLHFRTIPVVVVPLLSLTVVLSPGCGGGGGGGGITSSPLAINTGNAPQVSAQSAQVSGAMGGTSSSGGGVTAAGLRTTASSRLNLAAVIEQQAARIDWPQLSSGVMRPQALPQASYPCSGGGSYTVTALSSTSGTLTASNCVDSQTGDTTNGTLHFSNLTGSTTNTSSTTSGLLSTSDFTINEGTHTYALNGSASIVDVTSGSTDTFTMSGGSLDIAIDGSGNTLSNYTMTLVQDSVTQDYSTSLDGTLDSAALGGSVTLHTITPLAGVNLDVNNPDSGSVKITGATNSSVTLTAIGSGNVKLEVDANGDGVVDADGTSTTTWSALEAMSL